MAPRRPLPSGQEAVKFVAGVSNQITVSGAAWAAKAVSNRDATPGRKCFKAIKECVRSKVGCSAQDLRQKQNSDGEDRVGRKVESAMMAVQFSWTDGPKAARTIERPASQEQERRAEQARAEAPGVNRQDIAVFKLVKQRNSRAYGEENDDWSEAQ